ncbi:MAG: TIGR03936 family radical SAM-associated protein [Rubripirellula sp.]
MTETETETPVAADPPLRIRYRIRFAKTGLLRWISHRDLARLWERLLRRAALKLSMTEGFHPKPRVAFPSALALGVESLDEVVELELAEVLTPQALLERLQNDNQPGLTIHSVCQLPERFGKAQLLSGDYIITTIEGVSAEAINTAIAELLAKETVTVERKKKDMTVTVASQITVLELKEREIQLTLAASESASLKPTDVLDLLGFTDWIEKGALITRVRVVLEKELESSDPQVMAVAQLQSSTESTK